MTTKPTTDQMTLRELCRAYGISRRAVQGYEKQQLVRPSGRTDRGYLLYNRAAQQRICQIYQYQQFGFTVREIRRLFTLPPEALRQALLQRRSALLVQRTRLEEAIQQLSRQIDDLTPRPPQNTDAENES